MRLRIEAAPMQGLTDKTFRTVYQRFFSGIDRFYTPFFDLKDGALRSRDRRELSAGPERIPLVPQIVASCAADARTLRSIVTAAGYRELNLNLGCPHPPVTRRRKGSGALPFPALVEALLDALFDGPESIDISVKTRLGLRDAGELESIVPVFNRFPLQQVVLHPRVATQRYRGAPDWEAFATYAAEIRAPVVANGDIESGGDVERIVARFPGVAGIMVGRGLLADPFLPVKIRGAAVPSDGAERLRAFHDALAAAYGETHADAHFLEKMAGFWRYFSNSFPDADRVFKRIRKARSLEAYRAAVETAFFGRPGELEGRNDVIFSGER